MYNNDWYVVALHHSGIPEKINDKIQTLDGQDFNPQTMDETHVKWVANEGIRASRITQTLKQALPTQPLLQQLFSATPESARVSSESSQVFSIQPQPTNLITMSQDNLQT